MKPVHRDVKILIPFLFLVCSVFFWFAWKVTQIPEPVIEQNTTNARDLRIFLEEHECDSSYLGVYKVENYGEMELFCENGEFFGEIPDVFSISLTEMQQKGWFLSVFCLEDDCYSIPTTILDGVMEDVSGKIYAERVK